MAGRADLLAATAPPMVSRKEREAAAGNGSPPGPARRLRAGRRLGQYRILRRAASGGFADVFVARDSIEGIQVALKVPHDHLATPEMLDDFRKEVRTTARLDHPNVMPIKTAGLLDGRFVIVQPLGKETLADRMRRRIGVPQALDWAEQLLQALAHAHRRRVVHCDVKPENILLFEDNRLRLADFGIAKVALRTIRAAGTGSVGYIAPEQAMGKPSARSDVFAAGLVIWRMLSGRLPEWPYDWPLIGHERVAALHQDLAAVLRRALEVDSRLRFPDASQMLAALRRVRPRALGKHTRAARKRQRKATPPRDWKQVRQRDFRRRFTAVLGLRHTCTRCEGPVSEAMQGCPWCGHGRKVHGGDVAFPAVCPRCKRGAKLDWTYCAWCHGGAIGPLAERSYTDVRYANRCSHAGCRGELMPFMRYCPWGRHKVTRAWRFEGDTGRCPSCSKGVVKEEWDWCPWCVKRLHRKARRGH